MAHRGRFGSLTRPAQLRRLRLTAAAALDQYGIEPDRLRLLRYEDNAVYLVDSGSERSTLRMSVRDGRSAGEQDSELHWMHLLRRRAPVPVPEPVRTRGGSWVATVPSLGPEEYSTVAVFRWITGRPNPTEPSTQLARAWGRTLAELHRWAEPELPHGFVRPRWGREEIFDRGYALSGARSEELLGRRGIRLLHEANEHVAGIIPPSDPDWGLIHADLHRGNVVVTPGGEVAVIDFDDCGFGHLMLDIATVLSSVHRLCADRPAAHARFSDEFLRSYQQVRPLPDAFDQLEAFLIMRDMVIINFLTHSQNPTVATWAPARLQEMLHHLAKTLSTHHPYPGLPTWPEPPPAPLNNRSQPTVGRRPTRLPQPPAPPAAWP